MTDSFGNPVFKESFKKFFEVDDQGDLKMGFLSNITVTCSKEIANNSRTKVTSNGSDCNGSRGYG